MRTAATLAERIQARWRNHWAPRLDRREWPQLKARHELYWLRCWRLGITPTVVRTQSLDDPRLAPEDHEALVLQRLARPV